MRIQMVVLFPVFSVIRLRRRTFKMDGESVTRDAGVKPLILEIEHEAKLVTVVGDGPVKIIDEKLRHDCGYASS